MVFVLFAGLRILPWPVLRRYSNTELYSHLETGLPFGLSFVKVGQACSVENTVVIYNMIEKIRTSESATTWEDLVAV